MEPTAGERALIITTDRAEGAAWARELASAGFYARFIGEPGRALTAVRQLRPAVVLLRGEVRSSSVEAILAQLAGDAAAVGIPIALVTTDPGEREFVRGLRTGVVELLPVPGPSGGYGRAVRALLDELPSRRGVCAGHGDSPRLTALVEHIRRTRRDGVLRISQLPAGDAQASFVKGALQSATYGELSGVEALAAAVAQPRGNWSFAEVSADGAGVVIDLSELEVDTEVDPEVDAEVVTQLDELPLTDPDAEELFVPIEVEEAPAQAASLLLVDDDEALCRMFGALFSKHGFEVSTAADGIEGYERAAAGAFDVIIADLNMPRMDGWGMLRLLRHDHRTRELPVAFLSCHDDYRDSLQALEAGAQAYFSKSIRLESLVGQVRELLRPREVARRLLQRGTDARLDLGALGPQWVLRTAGAAQLTGRLQGRDDFATYEVFLADGVPVHATAQAGRYAATGERAFNAFVASKGALGGFWPGSFPVPRTLTLSTEALLARAATTLNENERHAREHLMVTAGSIQVNPELYAVYARVGPKQWLEPARLICEDKLTPREVIARLESSPVELEEMLRDLVRRGVVTLTR